MAKKKVAKKAAAKKKGGKAAKKSPVKKAASRKKAPRKKASTARGPKKVARLKRPAKKTARPKKAVRKAPPRARKSSKPGRPPARKSVKQESLKPGEHLEKMTVAIEGPDKSGDVVATESLGGSIRVHHTVHPGAETTPIPGKTYDDLKDLGAGEHEVEVVKPVGPLPAAAQSGGAG